jgi:PTS system nitrogen regulatory IIA component
MESTDFNFLDYFVRGEVLQNVSGSTVEEIFNAVCRKIKLPEGLTAVSLEHNLLMREKILTTAVGNGIAIPHPRCPIVNNYNDSRIIVVYPKIPLNMNAPDSKKVSVMFILLSYSTKEHINILASLAKLFRDKRFMSALYERPWKERLIELIKEVIPEDEEDAEENRKIV